MPEITTMYMKGDHLYDVERNEDVWFGWLLNKEQAKAHGKDYDEKTLWAVVFPSRDDLLFEDGFHTCSIVPLNQLLEADSTLAAAIRRSHIGLSILKRLNKMDDATLKKKVHSIIGEKLKNFRQGEFFSLCGGSTRMMEEFDCVSISFSFYDSVVIDRSGIFFEPEHSKRVCLVEFNENFQLGE